MHVLHRFCDNVVERGLAAKVNLEALVQHEINGAPAQLLSPANSVYYKSTCSQRFDPPASNIMQA